MGTNHRPKVRTLSIIKSAVIMMERGENTAQAWLRHIKNHPEDTYADVKIFHFSSQKSSQNLHIV